MLADIHTVLIDLLLLPCLAVPFRINSESINLTESRWDSLDRGLARPKVSAYTGQCKE